MKRVLQVILITFAFVGFLKQAGAEPLVYFVTSDTQTGQNDVNEKLAKYALEATGKKADGYASVDLSSEVSPGLKLGLSFNRIDSEINVLSFDPELSSESGHGKVSNDLLMMKTQISLAGRTNAPDSSRGLAPFVSLGVGMNKANVAAKYKPGVSTGLETAYAVGVGFQGSVGNIATVFATAEQFTLTGQTGANGIQDSDVSQLFFGVAFAF